MSTFTYSQVPWFSQPSKGFDLFAVPPQSSVRKSGQGYGFQDGNQSPVVVRRRIAHRGHEIFVATGKEVRWASLPLVKSQWERAQVGIQKSIRDRRMRASSESDRDSGSQSESESESESDGGEENEDGLAHGYKRLAVPIRAEIQQLLISPNQQLLAIVTSHTCHVVIIPDSSLLASSDSAPVRAKTFTLGSTTHALDQPPLCTALWHPLGKDGGCLVTVAAGGIVRLWELNLESRWSFEEPALCVDLIDLANAETSDQTIGSPQAQRRGFTPDAVDFELTSACFGTAYSAGQSAWSPMTLWLTTTEADIYALCPFLPSNFQLPEYALDNFILNTIAGAEASWEDSEGSGFDKKHTTDRRRWAQDLEDQRSQAATGKPRSLICTFKRPDSLGPVPKLRGPFEIEGAFEEGEVATFTDIYVIGAGQESVDDDKDDDDASSAGDEAATATKIMGMDTVCVVTETGRILINLAQAVEGRWAKKKVRGS